MMNSYRRYYSLCSAYSGCQDDPADPCYGGGNAPVAPSVAPTPECLQSVNNLVARFNGYWLNQRVAEQLATSLTQLLFDPSTCSSVDVDKLVSGFVSSNKLETSAEHKQVDASDVPYGLVVNTQMNIVESVRINPKPVAEGFRQGRVTVKPRQCTKCHKRF